MMEGDKVIHARSKFIRKEVLPSEGFVLATEDRTARRGSEGSKGREKEWGMEWGKTIFTLCFSLRVDRCEEREK